MDTDSIPIIVMFAAFIVLGGVLAIEGKMMIARPLSRWLPRATRRAISSRITVWGILADDAPATQQEAVTAVVTQAWAQSIAGMGVGALFGALASLLVLLLVTFHGPDTSNTSFVVSIELALDGVVGGMVIGVATGHITGVRSFSRSGPPGSVRQPRRRVGDYISLALWCVIFTVYGLMAAINLAVGARSPGLDVFWIGSAQVHWPGIAVGGMQALGVVMIPLVSLLCARWIARSPNLVIEADEMITARVGDLLRAQATRNAVLAPMLSGFLFYLLGLLDMPREAGVGVLGALYHAAPFIMPFLILLSLGFSALSDSAQLGGRLTGWPWQRPRPGPYEQAVTAQGRE
ncbi:MAG TPA: hypothetical protein VFQ25_16840 [Ktedonobacterales bacterium]|nr:hypothetical protein [Ktedonobacterales bacterium]